MKRMLLLFILLVLNISVNSAEMDEAHMDDIQDYERKLRMMVHKGSIAEVQNILKREGININSKCPTFGSCALHYAVVSPQDRIMVTVLLDAGADKNVKDNEGETAEQMARRNKNNDLADYIRDYGLGSLVKSAGKR